MAEQRRGKSIIPVTFRTIFDRLPDWRPTVIFDVGANVGQSAVEYAAAFPAATVHSFEPVRDSYARLTAATAALPNVIAHPIALGHHNAVLKMSNRGSSTQNHILADQNDTAAISVPVRSGAGIMAELKVDHISFLKIDTEGHDLDVLKGFATTLERVDFIQVEAGMNPYNTTHVPYHDLSQFLFENGFLLFHIFDQVFEFKKGGRPVLRRCNPVFIRASLVDLTDIH